MVDPPSDRSIDALADWIELSTLFGIDDVVSRAEVLSGLLSTYTTDEEDEEDEYDVILDLVWTRLSERQRLMGAAFPFEIKTASVRRLHDWKVVPAYSLLLLCEAGRLYKQVKADAKPGSRLPKLFEYVVKAAQIGLFRGTAFRFGWPVDPPDSHDAPTRLKALAAAFSVKVLEPEAPLGSEDKDAGLDVCARLLLGDQLPGTAFVFIQCAAGGNWESKTGEPSLEKWKRLIDWPAITLRAVAIPWRIGKDEERRQDLINATLNFELAIILDRYRLVCGHPDIRIEASNADSIREWCVERIAELPLLENEGANRGVPSSASSLAQANQSP